MNLEKDIGKEFSIDCTGKTIEQKRILWDILKMNNYNDCAMEDGMFKEGNCWYNATYFLFCHGTFHPRNRPEENSISYDGFMLKYCHTSWRNRYKK